jgi:hypothetical protein
MCLLSSSAFAADQAADQPSLTVQSPGADAQQLLGEIDLRVLLQHYEKLKTEIQQTKLQMALQEAGAVDPATADAAKELAAKQYDKTATPEEKDMARKKYEESVRTESEKIKTRFQVLENLADTTRKEVEVLAGVQAARAQAIPHPTSFQPHS